MSDKVLRAVLCGCAMLALAAGARADTPEPGSAEEIAAATTEPRFLSPWVASLPDSPTVPSPREFLKRIPGAPGELVNSSQAYAYLRALAAASPHVRYEKIGTSEEGRDIVMVAIADEDGIRRLDELKATTARLADPRRTDAAAASALIESGRPIYYFNAALHSDETGSTESVLELAYRLAVSDDPRIARIRSQLVVLINPVSNPDGRDKQVEWFYKYLKGRTDRETLPRQSPPYWSKYAFVDINRDAHQQTHFSTQAVHRMFFEWHPTVVHDLHEAVALLMTWNGTGPYNPNIDPLTYSEFLELSMHEVQAMNALGMPGVSTWNFGEAFSHLYLDSVAMNHNAIGRGYETWGNGTAETLAWTLDSSDTSSEWWRLVPPPAAFRWSARDNVNYNETGMLAALDFSAAHSKELLANYYRKGVASYRKGLDEAPYGFIIPADQGDPARVAALVNRLLGQEIEVGVATAPVVLEDGTWPAGTYVVRLDQPYRNYAVDLLTAQHYPIDGGEPYDDVSWSLPAHYHLDVRPTADPAVRSVAVEPLTRAPAPAGGAEGAGAVYLLADTGQESLLEARFRLGDAPVEIAERPFSAGGREYPAGSWIVRSQGDAASKLASTGRALGLEFTAATSVPDVPRHAAPVPRLCLYVPWADTDSIGWVRYSLDQRHVPYTYLRDEDVRAGNLRSRCDVIVYGHVDLELAEQLQGLPTKWSPMAYKRTAATPSLGTPASSDDITGGLGGSGLASLQTFVDSGGLLATLGNATMLALEAGIVRGVRRESGGVPRSSAGGGADAAGAARFSETRTPGAHLRVTFDRPDHPIAYGYPARTYVFRQNFAVYSMPRAWLRMAYCTTCLDGPFDPSGVVMEWGDKDGTPLVVSGQAWGEAGLVGHPAILDLPSGRGHVIAYNFNPIHRDLNRGDQRLLWNTIINWQAIVAKH
ncbi:MAG: M14 family zinc carboxypeptidase [Steroidobacteraceae bacterium]